MYKSNKVQVVPWNNAAEFKEVYRQLYSPEISNKKQAVDQIAIWGTRCHPSLPAAIDSSLAITTAIIQDTLWTNFSSIARQIDIQFMYSSAIIRFVNLTVDVHGKQKFPGSLAYWAKKLGIPAYIVDIRNEATHSVMPSLGNLRLAAEHCMTYLKERYWEIEASNMTDYTKEPSPKDMDINELLRCYANLKLRVIYRKDASLSDDEDVNLELEEVFKNIRSQIRKKTKLFAEMLATSDVFIPCEEDFKSFVMEEEFLQFQAEYEINESHDDASMDSDKAACIPKIPFYHGLLWNDLINLLHSVDAVPFFLECLLKSQGRQHKLGQKLIISWVNTILSIYQMGCYEKSILKWIFKEKGIVVDWHRMLLAAVQNPCEYVPFVLQRICCHLNVKRDTTSQELMQLTAIYLGQVGNLESLDNHSFFTVEDIKEAKKLKNTEQKNVDGADENIFFHPPDDCYKDWPLDYRISSLKEKENEISEEIDFEVYDRIVEKIFKDNKENVMVDCSVIDSLSSSALDEEIREELSKIEAFLYIL